MRVTNLGQQQQLIQDLQARLSQFDQANQQLNSGLRFTRASEDPVAAKDVMQLNAQLTGLDQFDRNSTFAQGRQQAENDVLTSVSTLMAQARQIAATAANTAVGSPERAAAAAQVDQIFKEVISYGNTQFGGEYLFSGGNAGSAPFDTAAATEGNYLGGTITRTTAIDPGVNVAINDRGDTVFGDPSVTTPGIITSLKNLRDGLAGADTPATILTTRMSDLVNASDNLQQTQANVAGRLVQIDSATTQRTATRNQVSDQKDAAQGIDPTTAAANVLALQTSIQAAYSATSRILGASLVPYLTNI